MTAKELRIGNWVSHIPSKNKTTEANFIVSDLRTFKENTINGLNIEDCEPIPLTEEWLLKFGFERNGKKLTFWKIDLVEDEEGIFSFDEARIYIDVKYVHQLQNLYFALTNEELTFKSE